MATIVGFDTNRNESWVIHVVPQLISNKVNDVDEQKALHALLVKVVVEYEPTEPTRDQIAEWECMSVDDLYNEFDDLRHVKLIAVFAENVDDTLS